MAKVCDIITTTNDKPHWAYGWQLWALIKYPKKEKKEGKRGKKWEKREKRGGRRMRLKF